MVVLMEKKTTQSAPAVAPHRPEVVVRSVWADNMEQELAVIRRCVQQGRYRYAAVDTEFPGNVFGPNPEETAEKKKKKNLTKHHSLLSPEERYAVLKANVDGLHLIQLGLTLADEAGRLPDLGSGGRELYVWEFNFREFDPRTDPHAPGSVDLLRSCGLDLDRHRRNGVDARAFGALLLTSGLFLNRRVRWITFQGAYDLGYLLKALTRGRPLPPTVDGYVALLGHYFGYHVYDVKHMTKNCHGLHGGLDRVAELMRVERPAGGCHQAGSDSLLTAMVFMKMRSFFFSGGGGGRGNGRLQRSNMPPALALMETRGMVYRGGGGGLPVAFCIPS